MEQDNGDHLLLGLTQIYGRYIGLDRDYVGVIQA